jgi:hypothetical protein
MILPQSRTCTPAMKEPMARLGIRARAPARTLALPDAQSVEDLTALLTSAGER